MIKYMMILAAMMLMIACGEDTNKTPAAGSEGGPCYGNGTCDGDLVCLSNLCVDPTATPDIDSIQPDNGTDDISDNTQPDETVDTEPTDDILDNEKPDDVVTDGPTAETDMPLSDDTTADEAFTDEATIDEDSLDDWFPDVAEVQPDFDMVDGDILDTDQINTDTTTVDEDASLPDNDVTPSGIFCTGQTKCYSNTAEITCPTEGGDFFGQDYQYAAVGYCIPRSYSISGTSGNDVFIDNVTGLIWQRTLPATYPGCNGGVPVGSRCSWQGAINYCDALSYAGHNDWRLPSRKELATLPDYGRYNPAIDPSILFPSSALADPSFWSSSSYADNFANAWSVEFSDGTVYEDLLKEGQYYVRCMRGDSLTNSSFTKSTVGGDSIVTDNLTKLMWATKTSGLTTWQNALVYCENLNYAGYADWRLPNIEELKTLIDDTLFSPASSFPSMPQASYYWSSTSVARAPSQAWCLTRTKGDVYSLNNKTMTRTAFCVR